MLEKNEDEHFECIYCMEKKSARSFNKVEHVIPQSFGVFKNNFTLHNTVCDGCNQFFGDNLEIALARDSIEGLSRYEFGVKEPCQFKPSGKKTRIITKVAEGVWRGAFVFRVYSQQLEKVVIELLPQIGFLNADGSGYVYYLLPEVPDKKTLDKLGFDLSVPKSIKVPNSNTEEAIGVLKSKGIPFKVGGEILWEPPPNKDILCEVEAAIDQTIFRAVAKIALNYLAYWEGSAFVRQAAFMPIREFIRYGRRTEDPLVIVRDEPVLGDERGTEKRRLGHVIILNWAKDDVSIVSHLSIMNWAKYSVSLAQDFMGEKKDLARGHFFNLYDNEIFDLEVRKGNIERQSLY